MPDWFFMATKISSRPMRVEDTGLKWEEVCSVVRVSDLIVVEIRQNYLLRSDICLSLLRSQVNLPGSNQSERNVLHNKKYDLDILGFEYFDELVPVPVNPVDQAVAGSHHGPRPCQQSGPRSGPMIGGHWPSTDK